MTHLFGHVCNLLSGLEEISSRDPPYLPARRRQLCKDLTRRWFSRHNVCLQNPLEELVALFSALLPAKRTDRVYNVQNQRLVSLLKRCLGLGFERAKILDRWREPGHGDLGDCVERVLRQTDDPSTLAKHKITVVEVDRALTSIASRSRFSSSKIRQWENDAQLSTSLEIIYRRLHSRDAKWLTRMLLKDFSCIDVDMGMLYAAVDFRFEAAMRMYDNFEAAITELQKPASPLIALQASETSKEYCVDPEPVFKPRLSVKIGPPKWVKARGGVQHLMSLVNGKKMSVEQKLDGEYCQVHVDLKRNDGCIQIFSKSGKDSTTDRAGVHDAIKRGLRIGQRDCRFRDRCILEGELVVWSEDENKILDFHKIRKHVSRSGSYLGTTKDSQQHPWERLMIVFYDVMLIDDDFVLQQPYEYRRRHLRTLVARIPGESDFVWRKIVDFSSPKSLESLKTILANAFARRWEGLVLKPVNEPYFGRAHTRNRNASRWIKIKKDCIPGHGDTADLVAIGAGYDAKAASRFRSPDLSWTHIFIGCLKNKDDVKCRQQKPQFFVLDCLYEGIGLENLKTINRFGKFCETPVSSVDSKEAFDLEFAWMDPAIPKMCTLFLKPFVLEIVGSGFDKPPNTDIFTLRFPRALRIHWDRDWKDAVSFDELQTIAVEAVTVPSQTLNADIAEWRSKLDDVCRLKPAAALTDEEDSGADIEGVPATSPTSTATHISKTAAAVQTESKSAAKSYHLNRTECLGPQHIKSNVRVVIPFTPPSTSSEAPIASPHTTTHLNRRDTSGSHYRSENLVASSIRIAEDMAGPESAPQLPQATPKSDSSPGQPSAGSPLESPLQEVINNSRPRRSSKLSKTPHSKPHPDLICKVSISAHKQAHGRPRQQHKGSRADERARTSLESNLGFTSNFPKRTWIQSEIGHTDGDSTTLSCLARSDRKAEKRRRLNPASSRNDEPIPQQGLHEESPTVSQDLNPSGLALISPNPPPSHPKPPKSISEKLSNLSGCVRTQSPISRSHTAPVLELNDIPSFDNSTFVLSQQLAEECPPGLQDCLSQLPHPPIKLSSQGTSPTQPTTNSTAAVPPNTVRSFHFLHDTDTPRPECAHALQQFVHHLYGLHQDEPDATVSRAYVWHWKVLAAALRMRNEGGGKETNQRCSDAPAEAAAAEGLDWLFARIEWTHAGRDEPRGSKIRVRWCTGRQTKLTYEDVVRVGKVHGWR